MYEIGYPEPYALMCHTCGSWYYEDEAHVCTPEGEAMVDIPVKDEGWEPYTLGDYKIEKIAKRAKEIMDQDEALHGATEEYLLERDAMAFAEGMDPVDTYRYILEMEDKIEWMEAMLSKAYSMIVDHQWNTGCECKRCGWIFEYHERGK